MDYESPWERLGDARTRVMAATGHSTDVVQSGICRAIADRGVKIRGLLGTQTITGFRAPNTIVSGKDLGIPMEIKPEDFDWDRSRPVKPWMVSRAAIRPAGAWTLDWVELYRMDVTERLCTPRKASESVRPSTKMGAKSRSSPSYDGAKRAFDELYPNGDPGQAALPNKLLYDRVIEKLKERGLPEASDTTILRAAGRRK